MKYLNVFIFVLLFTNCKQPESVKYFEGHEKYVFTNRIIHSYALFDKMRHELPKYTTDFEEEPVKDVKDNILSKDSVRLNTNEINTLDSILINIPISIYSKKNNQEKLQFRINFNFVLVKLNFDENSIWILKSAEYICTHLNKFPFKIYLDLVEHKVYRYKIYSGFIFSIKYDNTNLYPTDDIRILVNSKSAKLNREDIRVIYISHKENIDFLKDSLKLEGELIFRDDFSYREDIDYIKSTNMEEN